MILGKWKKKRQEQSEDIHALVTEAKYDSQYRNDFIRKYQPFIAKVASKVCKQYIDQSRDEYSVAIEAFNEAINHYENQQGTSFLSFAEMVIRRRVIDYIRKETRQTRDIFLETESTDEEQQQESIAQVHASVNQYQQHQEIERRRMDIADYQELLKEYDITFQDLVTLCPKHVDARENAKQIAKTLATHQEFVFHLKEKKQLPMKELLKFVNCSRKTVERNRKYIIAMALIYIGGYESLQSYIEPEEDMKEGREISE
ncbi:RNA polymerase sigma-I factor [Caldalkalibacillus salinus]|uniref:RNA polymerase sigma-I factor n=1 Tax=Caldalkalibacillus salinus TaxID=2803787 RepID=UPI001922BD23|nr:RNA polymerase sigma-I factor [Caldalkalibacillus salinus]